MKTVYALMACWPYEYDDVIALFSTPEAATDAMNTINATRDGYGWVSLPESFGRDMITSFDQLHIEPVTLDPTTLLGLNSNDSPSD